MRAWSTLIHIQLALAVCPFLVVPALLICESVPFARSAAAPPRAAAPLTHSFQPRVLGGLIPRSRSMGYPCRIEPEGLPVHRPSWLLSVFFPSLRVFGSVSTFGCDEHLSNGRRGGKGLVPRASPPASSPDEICPLPLGWDLDSRRGGGANRLLAVANIFVAEALKADMSSGGTGIQQCRRLALSIPRA